MLPYGIGGLSRVDSESLLDLGPHPQNSVGKESIRDLFFDQVQSMQLNK
jgi:hypothetical protein